MAKMNTQERKAYVLSQKGSEPMINVDRYTSSLMAALNYYNEQHDNKEKRKWALTYVAKTDKKLAGELDKIDADYEFRSYGTLARMIMRGSELLDKETMWMTNRLSELKRLVPAPVAVADTKPVNVISIQDRIAEKAREIAGEIDGGIDDFVIAGCPKDFVLPVSIKSLNGPIVKHLIANYAKQKQELLSTILTNVQSYILRQIDLENSSGLKNFIRHCEVLSSKHDLLGREYLI